MSFSWKGNCCLSSWRCQQRPWTNYRQKKKLRWIVLGKLQQRNIQTKLVSSKLHVWSKIMGSESLPSVHLFSLLLVYQNHFYTLVILKVTLQILLLVMRTTKRKNEKHQHGFDFVKGVNPFTLSVWMSTVFVYGLDVPLFYYIHFSHAGF